MDHRGFPAKCNALSRSTVASKYILCAQPGFLPLLFRHVGSVRSHHEVSGRILKMVLAVRIHIFRRMLLRPGIHRAQHSALKLRALREVVYLRSSYHFAPRTKLHGQLVLQEPPSCYAVPIRFDQLQLPLAVVLEYVRNHTVLACRVGRRPGVEYLRVGPYTFRHPAIGVRAVLACGPYSSHVLTEPESGFVILGKEVGFSELVCSP